MNGNVQENGIVSTSINGPSTGHYPSVGQFDVLNVNGNFTFGSGSVLSIDFSPFLTHTGMFWDLIIANSISGFGNETIQVTGLLPNIHLSLIHI